MSELGGNLLGVVHAPVPCCVYAYHQIAHFLEDVYNRKRIHSALGYLTPFEFEHQQTSIPAVVH